MKRTIISLLLVVMLCMSLAIGARAAYVDFIIDSQDVLTDDERTSLNDMAAEIFEDTGVGVYYVYVYGSASVTDYNVHGLVREVTDDYYVMVENDDSWYYFAGGTGVTVGGKSSTLFVAGQDHPQSGVLQCLVQFNSLTAGVGKDNFNAQFFQTFDSDLTAFQSGSTFIFHK